MTITSVTIDGKPVTGIASVAVGAPEPWPEGDRVVDTVVRLYSLTQPLTVQWVTPFLSFWLDPPRHRRLSAMRTAYRAKTKHRRRKR